MPPATKITVTAVGPRMRMRPMRIPKGAMSGNTIMKSEMPIVESLLMTGLAGV